MEIHQTTARSEITAPPRRVWELVTDITLMPQFSPELQRVEWTGGADGPFLGARFTGVNQNPAIGEWTTMSTVIEFEPPRLFAWAVGDPQNPAATWRFDIEPAPAGSVVRYTAQIGPGPSGVTMLIEREPGRAAEIVARRLADLSAAMSATLAGIGAIAEGGR